MESISNIIKANKHYTEEQNKVNVLYKELKVINDSLNLTDVKDILTYSEVKELYNRLLFSLEMR